MAPQASAQSFLANRATAEIAGRDRLAGDAGSDSLNSRFGSIPTSPSDGCPIKRFITPWKYCRVANSSASCALACAPAADLADANNAAHQRPAEAADRSVPGHWEGDLMVGQAQRSAVGVLIERTTRYLILLHLTGKNAFSVYQSFAHKFRRVPAILRKTLTYDRGTEMRKIYRITSTNRCTWNLGAQDG